MKLISLDLAVHQTGIAIFDDRKLVGTYTLKHTLKGTYNPMDCDQLLDELVNREPKSEGLLNLLPKDAYIIIEYNTELQALHLVEFDLELKGLLIGLGYHILLINTNHWMRVASNYAIRRDEFPPGRDGNKAWIAELCKFLYPNHEFKSQDELDATLMGAVFLSFPSQFKDYVPALKRNRIRDRKKRAAKKLAMQKNVV